MLYTRKLPIASQGICPTGTRAMHLTPSRSILHARCMPPSGATPTVRQPLLASDTSRYSVPYAQASVLHPQAGLSHLLRLCLLQNCSVQPVGTQRLRACLHLRLYLSRLNLERCFLGLAIELSLSDCLAHPCYMTLRSSRRSRRLLASGRRYCAPAWN